MKKLRRGLALPVIVSVIGVLFAFTAFAQTTVTKTAVAEGALQRINEYYGTQTTTYDDGKAIDRNVISGPPVPPPGYELERAEVSMPEPSPKTGTNTLTAPAYKWVFGCSAVSGSMIAGYYDRNGFPDMYTGPTGGGMIPLKEDASWGTWSDGTDTYPNNPLIASHKGLDGRSTKGSIDDYWIVYENANPDPYISGSWAQHAWGSAVGDYMKTSQSAYGNTDGSTSFYTYTSSASPLACADMVGYSIDTLDGTYGRKLFYEARGYTVTDCYNQKTDNMLAGGFSFAQYMAEINAGRPVMLNLAGHTIVGVGYDSSTNTVYLHDTWDNSNHTMPWGGSYSGMGLQSVSIVNLEAAADPCSYTISTSAKKFSANGGSVSVTVKGFGATTCPVPEFVSSEPSWISPVLTSAGWKKNKGTVKVTVGKSATSFPRSGTVTFAGGDAVLTIDQAAVACSITKLTPSSRTFPVGGGEGDFAMTLSAQDCEWTAASSVPWITPEASGSGSAVVGYVVDPNGTGKTLSGKITVTLTANGKTKTHSVKVNKK